MRFGPHIWLLGEVCVVSAIVVGLLGLSHRLGGSWASWAAPWILSVGALLPTLAQRRGVHELGFQLGRVTQGVRVLCLGSAALLGAGLGVILLCKLTGGTPPLAAAIPRQQALLWIVAQFGYVALPEELFFRGYLIHTLDLVSMSRKSGTVTPFANMVLSAGVFGFAHLLALGRVDAVLTFFPGLIFAWLFVTTRSLMAPVLLHGAANVGYALLLREFA